MLAAAKRPDALRRLTRLMLQRGDFFLCSSPAQRDLWMGALYLAGRFTPQEPEAWTRPESLIAIVPFGHDGEPPLVADHMSPCSPIAPVWFLPGRRIDALDFYAYWKLFDALTDCAFYGKNREFALGNTPQQRFMGTWSDRTPVQELVVTDNPL